MKYVNLGRTGLQAPYPPHRVLATNDLETAPTKWARVEEIEEVAYLPRLLGWAGGCS